MDTISWDLSEPIVSEFVLDWCSFIFTNPTVGGDERKGQHDILFKDLALVLTNKDPLKARTCDFRSCMVFGMGLSCPLHEMVVSEMDRDLLTSPLAPGSSITADLDCSVLSGEVFTTLGFLCKKLAECKNTHTCKPVPVQSQYCMFSLSISSI